MRQKYYIQEVKKYVKKNFIPKTSQKYIEHDDIVSEPNT